MEFRHSVRESIEESGNPSKEKKSHAERSYDKYFEGYSAEITPRRRRNGKMRSLGTKYVYTGSTYSQKLSAGQRTGVRVFYVFAWLACTVLFVYAATRPALPNMTWYVTIFEAPALLGLGWMLIALAAYVSAPQQMKAYTYKSMIGFHFRISRIVAFAALAGTTAATFLNTLIVRTDAYALRIQVLVCMLICTLLIGAVCVTEDRIEYYEIKGKE